MKKVPTQQEEEDMELYAIPPGAAVFERAFDAIYKEAQVTVLKWLQAGIVVGLALLAGLFVLFAFMAYDQSFQQAVWVEVAGGVAIFAGVSVFIRLGIKFGVPYRILILLIAVLLGTLAYSERGVRQALLLEFGIGLVVLVGIELWVRGMMKRIDTRIASLKVDVQKLRSTT